MADTINGQTEKGMSMEELHGISHHQLYSVPWHPVQELGSDGEAELAWELGSFLSQDLQLLAVQQLLLKGLFKPETEISTIQVALLPRKKVSKHELQAVAYEWTVFRPKMQRMSPLHSPHGSYLFITTAGLKAYRARTRVYTCGETPKVF